MSECAGLNCFNFFLGIKNCFNFFLGIKISAEHTKATLPGACAHARTRVRACVRAIGHARADGCVCVSVWVGACACVCVCV